MYQKKEKISSLQKIMSPHLSLLWVAHRNYFRQNFDLQILQIGVTYTKIYDHYS